MASYGGIPTAEAVPVTTTQMVELTAPATLEEGYTFQAIYDGVTFPVTVPPGGVKQGQTMTVPFVTPSTSEMTPLTALVADDATKGQWKDGLCDCCTLGCCHASLCNACFCPQILMAQVLTRMKLSWLGQPTVSEQEWRMTFKRIFLLVVFYYIFITFFAPPTPDYELVEGHWVETPAPDVPAWQYWLFQVVSWLFGLYSLCVMATLRYQVRSMYQIPGHIIQDVCCVFWCGCCTVAQLARQTANYQQRRAVCCSDNGLPPTTNVATIV